MRSKQSVATAVASLTLVAGFNTADAGLVAHYEFDETSGTTATDSAGSNDGSLQGSTGTMVGATGLFGKAYSFDGSGDYVDLDDVSAVQPTGSFTASLWLKTTSVAQNNMAVLSAASGNANGGDGWLIKTQTLSTVTGTRLFFDTTEAPNPKDYVLNGVDRQLLSDTWKLTVLRYDSTVGTISITNLDLGVAPITSATVATKTQDNTGPANGAAVYYPSNNTTVGALSDGAVGFTGLIDDVRFYDHRLTDNEVRSLYNAAIPEPGSLALLGLGGLCMLKRRRR